MGQEGHSEKGPPVQSLQCNKSTGDTIEMVGCFLFKCNENTENVLKVVEQPSIPHVSENRGSFE